MQFLGSAKVDGSNRLTLVKEVAEILHVKEKDHIEFFIDNGDIVIRKVIPRSGMEFKNTNFWDWAERREIEIKMIEEESPEVAEEMREQLDSDKETIKELEQYQKKITEKKR